jgi:hypothetical protein
MVAKTGFVPPVNLMSESASIIIMELNIVTTVIATVRIVRYMRNISE